MSVSSAAAAAAANSNLEHVYLKLTDERNQRSASQIKFPTAPTNGVRRFLHPIDRSSVSSPGDNLESLERFPGFSNVALVSHLDGSNACLIKQRTMSITICYPVVPNNPY
ncbi:hypothetical protein MUCCIDRAFT_105830 [Mucor lusitanicus CBS 277.49]|uniref:Uncharacterized protein n=1 Tax=Mucor lusitanicus CBS 277.49 TaxID=747725 RepID=A0A162U216_MUCCL|nr:hypothetical protein MUCCIDRAFT_105830 [Mucor lusitanicus CBS 277.49]